MGGEIDCGVLLNELAYTIESLARSFDILEDDTEFVGLQGCIAVGHVAVEHVEQPFVLCNDDAVAIGVALGFDEPDAVSYLLRIGEVLIGRSILGTNDVSAFS